MEESRRILAELQQADWVDSHLDHDQVMAALADGQDAPSVLAARPPTSSPDPSFRTGLVVYREEDVQLLERLTALARAFYLRQPWPDPPDIPLDRLTADYNRTTDEQLDLALRWDPYPSHGMWLCDIKIDGRNLGYTAVSPLGTPDEMLVELTGQIGSGWIMQHTWGTWPLCPQHTDRPMGIGIDENGTATWICGRDEQHNMPIGQLRT